MEIISIFFFLFVCSGVRLSRGQMPLNVCIQHATCGSVTRWWCARAPAKRLQCNTIHWTLTANWIKKRKINARNTRRMRFATLLTGVKNTGDKTNTHFVYNCNFFFCSFLAESGINFNGNCRIMFHFSSVLCAKHARMDILLYAVLTHLACCGGATYIYIQLWSWSGLIITTLFHFFFGSKRHCRLAATNRELRWIFPFPFSPLNKLEMLMRCEPLLTGRVRD